MANKLSFILSMFLLIQILAFSGDLFAIQMVYTNLDSLSISVSMLIASKGGITSDVIYFVEKSYQGAGIENLSDEEVKFGDPLSYRLYRSYNPLIFQKKAMVISVYRNAVIGYLSPS